MGSELRGTSTEKNRDKAQDDWKAKSRDKNLRNKPQKLWEREVDYMFG